MKLVIDKKYSKDFAYKYIPEIIYEMLNKTYNGARITHINQELQINLLSIIRLAIKTLIRSETPDSYILIIDKRIKVKGIPLDTMINYITYGSRTFKGYPILLNIFSSVAENLDELYEV